MAVHFLLRVFSIRTVGSPEAGTHQCGPSSPRAAAVVCPTCDAHVQFLPTQAEPSRRAGVVHSARNTVEMGGLARSARVGTTLGLSGAQEVAA